MKINKILTILTFFLLLSCGFQPIYSEKKFNENYNFTINNIGFSGNNNINQYLKNNLLEYTNNEDKEIKYDLIINSSIIKTITYIEKKLQTDSATLGLRAFLLTFIVTTELGCINFVTSPALCLASIRVLITFIPPQVEPAQAPIKAVVRSNIGTNKGQFA